MDARDVVIRPWITEKSTSLMSEGKYVFEVHPRANKTQIKQAIEAIFDVDVRKVNTSWVRGKLRRRGRDVGRTRDRKKATVTVAPGQEIKIFEGL